MICEEPKEDQKTTNQCQKANENVFRCCAQYSFSCHPGSPDQQKEENQPKSAQKPNEHAGFYFSTFVKIIDPNTKEVLVQTRGDN